MSTLGRFEILEELGEGGFGTVYKARDTYLDRHVALKIPRFGVLASEADAQRFLREARAAGNLRHPNIVPIYDAGKIGNTYYIAAGFIEGRTLADRLEAEEKLNRREAAVLIQQLALALHYAHTKKIVHRDVKPANVMLDGDGEPLLMDFGTARREEGEVLRTREGMHIGTPAYMSPEQHAGQSHLADARSDQWALGVMLYEMLTGERPFQAPSTIQMAYAVRETEPEKPSALNQRIPKDLETICLKCLQKDPEKRYPTCQILADDVEHWLRGEPITARPIWPVERFVRCCKRNPAVTVLSIAVCVSMFLGTVVSAVLSVRAVTEKRRVETALNQGSVARKQAEDERSHVREEKRRADENLYLHQIRSVQQKWLTGDITGAIALLDACPDEHRNWEWGYLRRLCDSGFLTLHGHSGPVCSVAFDVTGNRVASASWDKTVKLWDAQTGREIRTLRGHAGAVGSVAWDPNGRRLASASEDRTVRIWDGDTGQGVVTLTEKAQQRLPNRTMYTKFLGSLAFSPDARRLASVSHDNTVGLWDADIGRRLHSLNGHREFVVSIAFSPDGKRLASACLDGSVKIWDTQGGQEMLTLPGHRDCVSCVAFSPDGKRLALGGQDQTVMIWDTQANREMPSLRGHAGAVVSVAFSPDGRRLASGGGDNCVKIWDTQGGQEMLTLRGHRGCVLSVAFSPDGKRLVSGGMDNTVKTWESDTDPEVLALRGHTGYLQSVAFSPDGQRLASGGGDGTVKVWNVDTRQEFLSLHGHTRTVNSVAFSPDGKRLASGSNDNTVRLWDTRTGKESITIREHGNFVLSVAFSPDGRWFASASLDGTVKLYDAQTGKVLGTLHGHNDGVASIAFSSDSKRLASGGLDRAVRLWDPASSYAILTFPGPTERRASVTFSPDGRRLASVSAANTVKLWDTRSGEEVLTLRGHTKGICSIAFSPDGKRLVSLGIDAMRIWETEKGQEVLVFRGQGRGLAVVTFSPDGKRLAAGGGGEAAVKVWDAVDWRFSSSTKGGAESSQ